MTKNPQEDAIRRLALTEARSGDGRDSGDLIERLFSMMSPASQERLMADLLAEKQVQPASQDGPPRIQTSARQGPSSSLAMSGFGPWRMCQQMMASVDASQVVDELDCERPAEVFGALGDGTRIKIIRLLQDAEMCVEDLVEATGVPQSTLSHHLRVLREAGLISVERRGRSNYHSLTPEDQT